MSSNPHFHHQQVYVHHAHPRVEDTLPVHTPPIPDLRFEQSYLQKIRRYVTVHAPHHTPPPLASQLSEVISIQWHRVIWITTRDQVISPFVQGALWAFASYFLGPFFGQLGQRVRSVTSLKLLREGSGVSWLRGWANGLVSGARPTSLPSRQS